MSHSMKGVTFGDIHTSKFGIYLSKAVIGSPQPKVYKVDIPGANGQVDFTEFFDGVKYENREIRLEFAFPQRNQQLLEVYSQLLSALHGKYFERIQLDDDSTYHYKGRVSVGELKKDVISKVTLVCDCWPYKLSDNVNSITLTVSDYEIPTDYLYGDVNGDGRITVSDVAALSVSYGRYAFE